MDSDAAAIEASRRFTRNSPVTRLAVAAIALGLCARLAIDNTNAIIGDYRADAKPAIDALSHLDLAGFAHSVPLMGSLSLILRAPLVALVRALGGSETSTYTAGAFLCALVLAALVVWLLREMGRLRRPTYLRAAIAALFIFTPFIGAAVMWGHPEELLAVTLCVAAVLAAHYGHGVWAGLALGLAVATKQWALVAAAPALVALPRGRWRLACIAGAVVALFTLPAALADTHAFTNGARSIASAQSWVSVVSVWWPVSNFHTHIVTDGVQSVAFTTFRLPASLNMIPHALIVTIGLPLGAMLLTRRRSPSLDQVLSFLALMLLLRCLLDPWDNVYYQLPLMVGLYVRDALCSRRLPIASAFATVLAWATFWHVVAPQRGLLTYAFYMTWTVPLGAWLVVNTFNLRLPSAVTAPLPSPRSRAVQAA